MASVASTAPTRQRRHSTPYSAQQALPPRNSRSPFQTSPPSNARSRLLPPTSRSPATISARPAARGAVRRSPSSSTANTAVHSGSEPGSSTAAWAAGA